MIVVGHVKLCESDLPALTGADGFWKRKRESQPRAFLTSPSAFGLTCSSSYSIARSSYAGRMLFPIAFLLIVSADRSCPLRIG